MTKSYSMNTVVAVLGVLAMVFAFMPMTASAQRRGNDRTVVTNNNNATVNNTVEATAGTGNNSAGGSNGGDGGRGGNAIGSHGSVDTGDGNNGGNSGPGGLVRTGNAVAYSGVLNTVNSNASNVRADRCGCDGEGSNGGVAVRNDNHAHVGNNVHADAYTGDNWAGGSSAGNGGNGGDVNDANGRYYYYYYYGRGSVDTGKGGKGGNSGYGGTVRTGNAYADAGAVSVVNTNLTRVRR